MSIIISIFWYVQLLALQPTAVSPGSCQKGRLYGQTGVNPFVLLYLYNKNPSHVCVSNA